MKNVWLAPQYYKDFHCKADRCRSSCCRMWQIPVSKKEYDRLMTMEASEELDRRAQNAFRMPETISDSHYRSIAFNWLGNCPIQQDGLCFLHQEKGESYLPKVCRLYPRSLKSIDGVKVACCSSACEAVVELLYAQDNLHIEEMELDEEPQLFYEVREEDVSQIKMFNELIRDKRINLAESIAAICMIINKEKFVEDFKTEDDPLKTALDLFTRFSKRNDQLEELSESMKERYGNIPGQFEKDRRDFEKRCHDWQRFLERLINNSMIYECFPFIDERADRTMVYKGLCCLYGLLRLVCIYSGREEDPTKMIDNVACLFHIIEHTPFYYHVSLLSDNAVVMLKL